MSRLRRFSLVVYPVLLLAVIQPAIAAEPAAELIFVTPPVTETWQGPVSQPAGDVPRFDDVREGWPVELGTPSAGFPYTPTLFDIDGDGAAEIFLTGGHTFGLRGDGSFLPGWPTVEQIYMGYGTNGNMPGPSVADVDLDGDNEVLWTTRDWWAGPAHLWTFNGRNLDGSDMPGFPQFAPDDYSNALQTPFVLGDTDGDDDLEAWGPHTMGNTGTYYRISALDHLGNLLFTVDLDPEESVQSLYYGDLDGDGNSEMFAVSWLDPSFWLHVFTADGSEEVGYPLVLLTLSTGWLTTGPPVPADLDGDGDLEIILGHWSGAGSTARCFHHDGTVYDGFPISIATSSQLFSLGLGDVTGDGAPELIAFDNHLTGNYRVHVFGLADGLSLPGWPVDLPAWPKGIPTVADVDGDGVQDVCFVTDGGLLYAVAGDGQPLAGYPKTMVSGSISGVAVGDIDGDGLFELVAATWDGWVYAWDTPAPANYELADWPMRGIDARNTGVFGGDDQATAVGELNPTPNFSLRILGNPVTARVEFLIEGSAAALSLEIFDVNGRRVDELSVDGRQRLLWHPDPTLPAGVYLARLTGGRNNETAKFVIVR